MGGWLLIGIGYLVIVIVALSVAIVVGLYELVWRIRSRKWK